MKTNKSMQVSITSDKDCLPGDSPGKRIVEVRITAPARKNTNERAPLNISLVLDRSGSMHGEKLHYVKNAAAHVIDLLAEKDMVSLITYDDTIQTVLPPTQMLAGNKALAKQHIESIHSGGSTFLIGGWLRGCEMVAEVATEKTFNRTLLLTDGLANVGERSPEALAMHARALFTRGVSTSCFGVGLGYDEFLLENMASNGGGNFHFLETLQAIPLVFEREFQALVSYTLFDVVIDVILPAGIQASSPGGWLTEQDGRHFRLRPGSLVAENAQAFYLILESGAHLSGGKVELPITITAKDEDNQKVEQHTTLSFAILPGAAVQAKNPDKDLMARFAEVDMADKVNEALKLERRGDRRGASDMLKATVSTYDPFLDKVAVDKYMYLSDSMQAGLHEDMRKSHHRQFYENKKGRMMFREYPARLERGALVAHIEGLTVLIASSVPISLGRQEKWYFFDKVYFLQSSWLGLDLDQVSARIGQKVDVVLGQDILQEVSLLIKLDRGLVVFSHEPINGAHHVIPLEKTEYGPVFRTEVNGLTASVCLDTAAGLSLVKERFTAGCQFVGQPPAWQARLGAFDTPVCTLPFNIGHKEVLLRTGLMPNQANSVMAGKIDALIGTELLGKMNICLDHLGVISLD